MSTLELHFLLIVRRLCACSQQFQAWPTRYGAAGRLKTRSNSLRELLAHVSFDVSVADHGGSLIHCACFDFVILNRLISLEYCGNRAGDSGTNATSLGGAHTSSG